MVSPKRLMRVKGAVRVLLKISRGVTLDCLICEKKVSV